MLRPAHRERLNHGREKGGESGSGSREILVPIEKGRAEETFEDPDKGVRGPAAPLDPGFRDLAPGDFVRRRHGGKRERKEKNLASRRDRDPEVFALQHRNKTAWGHQELRLPFRDFSGSRRSEEKEKPGVVGCRAGFRFPLENKPLAFSSGGRGSPGLPDTHPEGETRFRRFPAPRREPKGGEGFRETREVLIRSEFRKRCQVRRDRHKEKGEGIKKVFPILLQA